MRTRRRRLRWILAAIGGLAALYLVVVIDDWKRDFTTNHAEISDAATDPRLKPLILERPETEVVRAVKWAADRIKDWEYVGDVEEGGTTRILFVRTSRVWGFKDDVTIRVESRKGRVIVTGESRSRADRGDLGQNPRNLRRLIDELRAVLAETAPGGGAT